MTILLATDFSHASESAWDAAVDLARAREAELVIAHVYPPRGRSATDDFFAPGIADEIEAAACAEAMKRLEPLVTRARNVGVRARALVLEGSAESKIVSAARATNAELVVIGTHGRRGVRRLLLGSVATEIVARAPCPVLTVRPA